MTERRRQPKHIWSLLWAARFIAKWEGFLPEAVLDTIASPPVWTIGYGHTLGTHPGERWSRAHALRVLMHDCRWAAAAVAHNVTIKLTVRQRIALISFVFNLGPGVLPGSQLLKALNSGHIHQAANLMLDYDHAGGVVVEGLRNRRKAERWMMLHSER
jgi:lysozyme